MCFLPSVSLSMSVVPDWDSSGGRCASAWPCGAGAAGSGAAGLARTGLWMPGLGGWRALNLRCSLAARAPTPPHASGLLLPSLPSRCVRFPLFPMLFESNCMCWTQPLQGRWQCAQRRTLGITMRPEPFASLLVSTCGDVAAWSAHLLQARAQAASVHARSKQAPSAIDNLPFQTAATRRAPQT